MDEHLTKGIKIVPAVTTTEGAAAATAIHGAILDMVGFDAVCVLVPVGTIVTNAVTSFKVTTDDVATMDGDGLGDLEGSNVVIADDKDNTAFYQDIVRPGKRYLRLEISRATQNATFGACYYLLYNAHEKPVTQPASVTGEVKKDPAQGSA